MLTAIILKFPGIDMRQNAFFSFALIVAIFAFQTSSFSFDDDAKADDFKRVKIIITACMDVQDSIKIEDGELMWVTTPKKLGSIAYLPGQNKNCGSNNTIVPPKIKIGAGESISLPMDERYWKKLVKEISWNEPREEFYLGIFKLEKLGFKEKAQRFDSEILFISEKNAEENQKTCPDSRVSVSGQNSITVHQGSFGFCQFQFTYMYMSRDN